MAGSLPPLIPVLLEPLPWIIQILQLTACVSSNGYIHVFLHRAGPRPEEKKMQEVGQTGRPRGWKGAERLLKEPVPVARKLTQEEPTQVIQPKP